MNNEIKLSFFIYKDEEDKYFLAECPELKIITQGNTRKEASDNIKEAITGNLETCIEVGIFEKVLERIQQKNNFENSIVLKKTYQFPLENLIEKFKKYQTQQA
jgi:predicted RNase H-like HicB family nuclease